MILSLIITCSIKTIVETKKKALSGSNSKIWCSIVDAFQTAAIENVANPKLKNLVGVFNLSAELLG